MMPILFSQLADTTLDGGGNQYCVAARNFTIESFMEYKIYGDA
jgi:hypothetical protein